MTTLADKACLVSFRARCWRGVHVHRDETAAENHRHNTDRVGVSVKASNHPALASLVKLHAAARQEHYRLTLPCSDDGMRFLPYGREIEHSKSLTGFSVQHDSLAARFLADYDQERSNAKKALNGLYRDEFFPPLTEVKDRFQFKFRYLSVPSDSTWGEWLAESAQAAADDLKERLQEAVRSVYSKCKHRSGEKGGVFRDSLIENLQELLNLVPDLNITNDPLIADVADKAKDLIVSPDILREDDNLRKDNAEKAKLILGAFGQLKI